MKYPTALPEAIVLGLSPTALHVIRTLGQAGVRVTGVGPLAQAGAFSRHLARRIFARGADEKLELLRGAFPVRQTGDASKPILIPTSDQDVEFVIDHASELGAHFAFQDSYTDGSAALLLEKDRFYDFCSARGFSVPRSRRAHPAELVTLGPDLSYPCLLKPTQVHRIKNRMAGRKVWIVQTHEKLAEIAEDIGEDAGTILIQEIVPGPESEIAVCCLHVDRYDKARQVFTARKLRQYPPGFGSASLVESETITPITELAKSILGAMGYHGIAALEFKRDPQTGEWRIIEINARPSLWFGLTDKAGRNPVLSAYLELAGAVEMPETNAQMDGVRWRFLLKDSYSACFYRSRADFILPPPAVEQRNRGQSDIGAVFSSRDPAPVIGEGLNLGLKLVSRALGRQGSGRRAQ